MAGKPKFTAEQVITAIRKHNGMLTRAADYLQCTYNTIRRYIDNMPSVKEAYQDARYRMADSIESTLLTEALGKFKVDPNTGRASNEYEREPNVTALIFLAKTHPAMRERGYSESGTVVHDGKLQIEYVYPDNDHNPD